MINNLLLLNDLIKSFFMILKEFSFLFILVSSLIFFTIIELNYKINCLKKTNLIVSIFYTVTLFMLINLILYSFFYYWDESKFFLFNFSLTNLYGYNSLLSLLIIFFSLVFLSSISDKFFNNIKYIPFESNFILGFLFIGIIFLIYSFDFLTMFLNLELQNFALYILMNIQRNKKIVIETSIKYYIIGGVSSAFILYGISLIYISTGKINFFDLVLYFYNIQEISFILFLGIFFIFCGLFIKLGLAPFHFWVPQIYSGVPNFITLILLSLPKFVLIIVFIKLYFFVFSFTHIILYNIICFCLILSLFFGSLGALWQINIKQFFGYSAITNTGFILLGLINFSSMTLFAGYLYLIIYLLTTVIIFYSFMVIKLRQFNIVQSFDFYNFTSLILINPVLLFTISINFLSLAGLPPMPGFFIKFFILLGLIELESYKLVFFMILISILAAYYYIRPIKIIFFSILIKPKFFVDFPFRVVILISIYFFFNLQFIYHLDFILNLFEYFGTNFNDFFVND